MTDSHAIVYSPMTPADQAGAVQMILEVFDQFVGPLFSPQGIAEFKVFAGYDAVAKRSAAGNPFILARCGNIPVGVLEIRESCHISLLFVKKAYQGRGISRHLVGQATRLCRKENPRCGKITVNASPNAVGAYERLGFTATGKECCVNGIRFIPMTLDMTRAGD